LEMDNWLREEIKYHSDKRTRTAIEALEECRNKLREVLEGYELCLDSIT